MNSPSRSPTRTERVASGKWHPDRVLYMVRNEVYAGPHILHSGQGGDVDLRPRPRRDVLQRRQAARIAAPFALGVCWRMLGREP